MRWLADFVRAGLTGVMWMVMAGVCLVFLGVILNTGFFLAALLGLVLLCVILVMMALTIAIWRVAISWQGTGTPTKDELIDPAFDGVKGKRDTAHLMERLVDKLDDDELVELETLLMSRSDIRQME